MGGDDHKAAAATYKDRSSVAGVFAVICTATGEVWVGCSRDIESQQKGLWFALEQGSTPLPSLQASWTSHGQSEFRFEELDRLREDFPELGLTDELSKRQALWRTRLRAAAL